jgi:antitoxin component YwqK of YwqJK toxin-antitoxin module
MRRGSFFIFVSFLLMAFQAVAQKEQLPSTNVPLNKVDGEGKRNGTWWVNTPARKGEAANAQFGNYDHGVKIGKWYTLDQEGDISAIELYKNDYLNGEVKYYTKGILYCTGNYVLLNSGREGDSIVVLHPDTHEEFLVPLKATTESVRHGTWRFYDEETGKLLREEEYQADELLFKKNIYSAQDSSAFKKHELALPHNKGKFKKQNGNNKELLN